MKRGVTMRTAKDQLILNYLLRDGVSRQTAEFFVELLKHFEVSDPLISSSKKLAQSYGRSERTIRRYMQELTSKFNYIHKKPVWNNDDPDKPYIQHTIYSKTYHTEDLLEKTS